MAETPPSAHKSEPLKGILNSLNDPKGLNGDEDEDVDDRVTLHDVADCFDTNANHAGTILANQENLSTRASVNNNSTQEKGSKEAATADKGNAMTPRTPPILSEKGKKEIVEIFFFIIFCDIFFLVR
jgi:hypothetical protein